MNITDSILNGWNHPGTKPTIDGDPLKNYHEIIAFEVDGVRVTRDPTQPLYMGDVHSTSLVSRALAQFGTSQAWTAIYS